ncbi:PREDICTED: uncharacterized protein LOC109174378 [Ipomoea nil]|uniref:uncharacterized protein LOC109174378 n=1 Tax=Ipomoea nil TaxID=35883 RepID=UPI000900A334|nr:PREDICTED: uncharacterized protein LOC109174378 [Ipomoea nil]
MEQPPGFVAQGEICKLKKSLYRLKQSPRACVLLIVYVDDIVITGDDATGIDALKSFLKEKFHTKDLGVLKYFLGIEVIRSKRGIFLSQRKYVLDLLEESGLLGSKPCETPMDQGVKLIPSEGEPLEDPERYRRLVGKLNYLTITRSDITFPVSVVSQFMANPTKFHWEAAVRVVKYLKSAPGRGILYANHGHMSVEAFSDADWVGSLSDRKSTTGYCVFLGGNLVSWKSKKLSVVSRSSAESEYRPMTHVACEVMWLCNVLGEIGVKVNKLIPLWCNNKAAIHISSNPVFHECTKHIEVDCHFVREKVQQGLLSTVHV